MANYLRDFVPLFAKIAKPLYQLRDVDNVCEIWNETHEQAFQTVNYIKQNVLFRKSVLQLKCHIERRNM